MPYAMKAATERISKVSHSLAQFMYQQQGATDAQAPPAEEASTASGSDDEVIDAEYVEKD